MKNYLKISAIQIKICWKNLFKFVWKTFFFKLPSGGNLTVRRLSLAKNGNWWVIAFKNCSKWLVPGSRSRSKTAQDMSSLSGFSARFERFERFGRFVLFFFGKTAQTAQTLLKNRSFLEVIFERFFQARFKRFLSGLIKKTN